jgi:cytochrome c553
MMVVNALAAVALAQSPSPVPAKKELKPESVAPAEAAASANLPAWLFPIDPASIKPPATPPKLDDAELLSIPDSTEKFTAARIGDLHNPPDWFPAEHGPMPDIVAKGRAPKVTACAFCHTPTGQGRPENSALAGLPEKYIREQLEDFKSGKRLPSGPESYKPSRGMHAIAVELTDEEIDESAKYFSQFKLARRSWIIESLRIPRAEPKDWIYEEVPGTEDLEDRLLEVAPDITRHEKRDPKLQYNVYVPPGSTNRGKLIATAGGDKKAVACITCHGPNLKGLNDAPPIAGRFPTYLLRQLLAFKTGARTSDLSKQMVPVVEKLELNDLVDVAAYVGSLYP